MPPFRQDAAMAIMFPQHLQLSTLYKNGSVNTQGWMGKGLGGLLIDSGRGEIIAVSYRSIVIQLSFSG